MDSEPPRIDGRTARFQHRRPELLGAAAEYVLDNGLADLSLRRLAEALGVTHATLLRHFASKDELVLEVTEHIRADFETRLAGEIDLSPGYSVADLARALWLRLCEPREQRQFRLLFELFGSRSLGDKRLTESMIHGWVALISERIVAAGGWNRQDARALATLLLAQFRGLQLDLMLTGERARVDAALEISLRQFEQPHR
ncbi:TetR/AcrR family transcriptional regulator [Mycolicibacterium sp. CBMA 226]|uniref:TetR/AcrR family transcriptional regulator n=1 Tax=Mycolicibacterium sp. CBMA 226 TaxID=2606611 RepID=UPI0012DC3D1A|nr:TetR/AcrR family transcriptional regulator [Mycolicibacterium sp. CBMA 226]MUL75444.1 TetR/AcrR family transcriptional regulator [Mycolicibacterium sp. CBMA 226]